MDWTERDGAEIRSLARSRFRTQRLSHRCLLADTVAWLGLSPSVAAPVITALVQLLHYSTRRQATGTGLLVVVAYSGR